MMGGELPAAEALLFAMRYGHIPIGGPERLHEPLLEYDAWLKARQLVHMPARFRDWVVHVYPSN